MAPNRREYSNDLRSVVIQHFLNGDSYTEISKKAFVKRPTVQSMIKKYKNTKCIGNIIGRGRKRKTTAAVDRIIQRKLKVDRRKSALSVKIELEQELGVVIHEDTDGNLKVWGCFSRAGVGNLFFLDRIMDRFYYKEILEKNLLASSNKLRLGKKLVFQHDNDPKHTAGIVKDWLKEKGIEILEWVPYSPDLNPMEHMWDELNIWNGE
ncbi:unnamed protein product [Didymodactylos carnosus]|uniref:Tc1-like transposase DDE domain-containing protein n=1 Tax=Didymodactylos carnosus TaxID=1234261 RepID=A0A8S2SZ98_9BILA|nr:unnamed protein product [Didymodactylos carnosus]CAF4256432.1 unnamed protein product [Didymodactylos carnosus]